MRQPVDCSKIPTLKFSVLFWALLLWTAPFLQAVCECDPRTHEEKMEQASLVFSGALLESLVDKQSGRRTMLFDVADVYKGDPVDELRLEDSDLGSQCELVVQEGKPYLVFAHWQWGKWLTSRCWGTKALEEAKEESESLGLPTSAKEKLYQEMQKRCMGLYTTGCCLASIKAMRQGYFLPEPQSGCPVGFKPNTLRCAGALRWCIPVTGSTNVDSPKQPTRSKR